MTEGYRINQLTFSDQSTLDLPALTVIVGPNNSGKSRALKDIVGHVCGWSDRKVVVGNVVLSNPPNAEQLASRFGINPTGNLNDPNIFRYLYPLLGGEGTFQYPRTYKWPADFDTHLKQPYTFQQQFAPQLIALLTTAGRLSLISSAESSADARQVTNLLQALYASGRNKEAEIRANVADAFPGVEVALDFTVPRRLEFKIGSDFATLPPDPRDALPRLTECERLDDQGDGLRSYVGIIVALQTLNRPIVLIDEPEAFLHPPQAFKLGRFIASRTSPSHQIIVATHSVDVLRGIMFGTDDLLIARIDRIGEENIVNALDSAELRKLVLDPLLSASGVLNGLFYSGVIVTEADADSRFYQSLSNKAGLGVDVHFVNADNKQTVPRILSHYKRLGVRCAGIVDIDVLNKADEFKKQLIAAGITGSDLMKALQSRQEIDDEVGAEPASARVEALLKRIDEMRSYAASNLANHAEVLSYLARELDRSRGDASQWQLLKKGGASVLKSTQSQFQGLYQLCGAAGLFINPCGELEASLSAYGVEWQSDKRAWISRALQLIPGLESDLDRQPWKFLADVYAHLEKPKAIGSHVS